jgi:hypothetical protein
VSGDSGLSRGPDVSGKPGAGGGRPGRAGERGEAWTCALCGYKSPGGFPQCAGCAIMPACKVNHCPNCGYQFVESSVILTWISRAVHGIMRMMRRGGHGASP